MNKHFIKSLIILLVALNACTVEKRVYKKGYYVNWSNAKSAQKKQTLVYKPETSIQGSFNENKSSEEGLVASAQNSILSNAPPLAFISRTKTNRLHKSDGDCGDLITLRNGDEIKVKVIEVGDELIKYKRCDNLEGPLFTVSKAKVFSLRYANGTKDLFSKEEAVKPANTATPNNLPNHQSGTVIDKKLKIHPLSIWAFVLAILGLVSGLLSIVSIILSYIAVKRIKAKNEKYRGIKLAEAARLISFILLFILLLLLMTIFLI